jgi:hypothetical protein
MQGNVGLYPKLKKSKYGRYKEAWHLLRGRSRLGAVDRIEACAGEFGEAFSTQHSAVGI